VARDPDVRGSERGELGWGELLPQIEIVAEDRDVGRAEKEILAAVPVGVEACLSEQLGIVVELIGRARKGLARPGLGDQGTGKALVGSVGTLTETGPSDRPAWIEGSELAVRKELHIQQPGRAGRDETAPRRPVGGHAGIVEEWIVDRADRAGQKRRIARTGDPQVARAGTRAAARYALVRIIFDARLEAQPIIEQRRAASHAQAVGKGVAIGGQAGLRERLQPAKARVGDVIDDARHCVRAIDRRGAAGDGFDPLDQHLRDDVGIDTAIIAARRQAIARPAAREPVAAPDSAG
jgi:hypothetical protein